jgi:probable phosphoglycerate mutase
VTCHGGVINIWTAHVIGMPPRFFFYPDYTSIHRYLCAGTGQKTVRVLNEAVHLGEWVQAGQRGGGVTRTR